MIILSVFLAPFFHGQAGPLDEVELCLAPLAIAITLLVYRILSRRAANRYDRTLKRQHRRRAGGDS